MQQIISCCGVVCSACTYFGEDCKGCPAIAGKPFWLEYTGESICGIYRCCVETKELQHCGLCPELPCKRYEQNDPTQTPEQNQAIFQKQMEQLKKM